LHLTPSCFSYSILSPYPLCVLFSRSAAPRHLHSFPTRRSSDLMAPSSHCSADTSPSAALKAMAFWLTTSPAKGSPWLRESCLQLDRKSTRLNSSHVSISYAVFCLKKKKKFQS